jgi:hypothetical protein
VTDECDDGGGTIQCWRPPRRLVNTRRPRCSRLEEQSRNGREWLSSRASGIDESPAIEVIAHPKPKLTLMSDLLNLTPSLSTEDRPAKVCAVDARVTGRRRRSARPMGDIDSDINVVIKAWLLQVRL